MIIQYTKEWKDHILRIQGTWLSKWLWQDIWMAYKEVEWLIFNAVGQSSAGLDAKSTFLIFKYIQKTIHFVHPFASLHATAPKLQTYQTHYAWSTLIFVRLFIFISVYFGSLFILRTLMIYHNIETSGAFWRNSVYCTHIKYVWPCHFHFCN